MQGQTPFSPVSQKSPSITGRKRPAMQPNYHTLTNNAVFPTGSKDEVVHYHSKIVRNRMPKLAPTLHMSQDVETAEIYQGELRRHANESPSMSPDGQRERNHSGDFMSEYQY